jgi:SH3-like domain-containing protein
VSIGKVVRALAGLIVLLFLVVTVNGWWSDYKAAAPARASVDASATANATATAAPADTGKTVIVLTDGLNFRVTPDATGASIRGLKKGETFILVSQNGSWLEIRDPAGTNGWVNNNPQYVKISKK